MQSIALSPASVPSRAMSWSLPLVVPKEPAAPPNDAKLLDLMKGAAARRLFRLEQLEVSWDEQAGALWTFMRPRGRPSYNPDFLEDFHAWQRGISAMFADRPDDLHYLLLGSRTPGGFNI
jgi:DSF synthase